jgi:hypothetical protein
MLKLYNTHSLKSTVNITKLLNTIVNNLAAWEGPNGAYTEQYSMAITLATISDVQEYEPDILDFGIPNFDAEITKAQADVFRDLRIRFWPTYHIGRYDLTRLNTGNVEPDEDLYTASQLTTACVYNVLGFHIFPKLAKFDVETDLFERKMEYYRKEYEREFDLVLRDGVEYDADSSGTVDEAEKEPQYYLRLKR